MRTPEKEAWNSIDALNFDHISQIESGQRGKLLKTRKQTQNRIACAKLDIIKLTSSLTIVPALFRNGILNQSIRSQLSALVR